MAEVKKQNEGASAKKAPAKRQTAPKAEVKQETPAEPKKEQNTMVKEIFGSKNAMFMLNVLDIALASAYFISFLVTMIVLLASGASFGWLQITCQALTVLLFAVLFISNYACVRPSYNYKNIMKNCLFELIIEVVIIALSIIGFKSAFAVVAIVPQLLISAIEIWIAYASSRK